MKTLELAPREYQDIRRAIFCRCMNATKLSESATNTEMKSIYREEVEALKKVLGIFHTYTGGDNSFTITVSETPKTSFKDKVLTYLYGTYPQHHQVIAKFIIAFEHDDTYSSTNNPETRWSYFSKEDDTLHISLLDEDFNYYKDYMYPEELYDT